MSEQVKPEKKKRLQICITPAADKLLRSSIAIYSQGALSEAVEKAIWAMYGNLAKPDTIQEVKT
jgi:hypothetical protein